MGWYKRIFTAVGTGITCSVCGNRKFGNRCVVCGTDPDLETFRRESLRLFKRKARQRKRRGLTKKKTWCHTASAR